MNHEDITFAIVVWNDAERLRKLLEYVRPWFRTIGVAVQESPDDTLAVAMDIADIVVQDRHRGFGDASFGPLLQPRIKTTWTFKVDSDEWPTEDLLLSLPDLTDIARRAERRGVWIPFRSWVDGVEWEEQHSHLRLWKNEIRWPPFLHSRPMIDDTVQDLRPEDVGWIEHRRELDEMIEGYLGYYRIGINDKQWTAHNREMMRDATLSAAKRHGWSFVKGKAWWPGVKDAVFDGKEPPMVIYCAGPACSGTRMLHDMILKLGLTPVHASVPGYDFDKEGITNPLWITVPEWTERHGPGKWVVITRDPQFSGQCALRRGFVASIEEYPEFHQKAMDILSEVPAWDSYSLPYEVLVADPQGEFDKLADWLGVGHADVGAIFDGNQQYLEQAAPPAPVVKAIRPRKTGRKTPA